MFMGTITLVCSACNKTIGHPAKDILHRTRRICPACGTVIEVPQPDTQDNSLE
jgi:predicted RNA-binding Zn-ribbon protein involved in translation (DUF1610 family)